MSDLPEEIQARIAEAEAREPSGPNRMAAVCELMIPYLLEKRDAATDKFAFNARTTCRAMASSGQLAIRFPLPDSTCQSKPLVLG